MPEEDGFPLMSLVPLKVFFISLRVFFLPLSPLACSLGVLCQILCPSRVPADQGFQNHSLRVDDYFFINEIIQI